MAKRTALIAGSCAASAILAYPLGMAVYLFVHAAPEAEPFVTVQPWFSPSFAAALLITLVALPGSLAPFRASGFARRLVAVLAWVVVGHGLWLSYLFLRGDALSLGREPVLFTTAAQAALALFAIPMAALASEHRGLAAAALAAVGLLAFAAAPASLRPVLPAPIGAYLPLVLFALLGAASFEPVAVRRGLDFARPVDCAIAILRWTLATHLVWMTVLIASARLDAVPSLLPLATSALQIVATIALLRFRGRLSLQGFAYNRDILAQPAARSELSRGPAIGGRTAWIVSYTGVSDEPRVIRQARALLDDGWRVVVCGFDGRSPRPPEWTYLRLPSCDPFRPELADALRRLGAVCLRLSAAGGPGWLRALAALIRQRYDPLRLHIRRSLLREARGNRDLKADLVVANDYPTCDAAFALAQLFAAEFAVDCHEYAVQEHSYDADWVTTAGCVAAVQDHYLRRADLVTTVCEGIAELLSADHRLRRPALAVRSVPMLQRQQFRPTGERITVLYHGIFAPIRGLHTAIESLPMWRPEFQLLLRGRGNDAYVSDLRRRARELGVEHRLTIVPPVPFDEIVPRANESDIGYFSAANFSSQSELALPNKFFEYIMAGLALCILDMTEMGRLIREYRVGLLISEHSPAAIARTINSFTRETIDRFKERSLRIAEELNWEKEQVKLLAAYNEITDPLRAWSAPARGAGAAAAIAAHSRRAI